MSFSNAYTPSTPIDHSQFNAIPGAVRTAKLDLQERFAVDHYLPDTDVAHTGFHKKVTFYNQGSDPTEVADTCIMFAKDADSKSEIHVRHEDAATIRWSKDGKIYIHDDSVYDASNRLVKSGSIVGWHGLLANIPSGYYLCDGNNSTPNTVAKFIRGIATAATEPGSTGGAATINLLHSHTVDNHVHTVSRDGWGEELGSVSGRLVTTSGSTALAANGINTGGATPATTSSLSNGVSILPPYYELAWMMKS